MMNSMPGPRPRPPAATDLPAEYAELLAVADGFICGPVVMFDATTGPQMQFCADGRDDAAVQP
jgi:hypothetical protein